MTLIVLLKHVFRHMKEKEDSNRQEEFIKIKAYLTNLAAFYNKINAFVYEQKCFSLLSAASPIKRTHLEIIGIFKLLGMIYLQISASVRYCSRKLCFMAPM